VPIVNRITRRDLMTLGLILLVAAVMRLGEPGVVEFKHDEAWLSLMAQDMLSGGPVPLTGIPSSVGVPNPPVSVYVMALPYALSNNPLVATMFVALLNVCGVGLLWLLAHRYLSRNAALVAGLAYALNPYAILFSRKVWAQDFHTPFVLLALLLGLYGVVEGKRRAQVLCLPVLVLALQIHFAAWALFPLYVVLLIMGRGRLSWRALALSVLLAALCLVPYLIGLSRTLEQDPNRISNAVNREDNGLSLSGDALTHTAQLATGIGMEQQIVPDETEALLASVPAQAQLWALLGALAVVGAVVIWTKPYRQMAVFVVLWAALPLMIFTPTWTQIYPHYFIASIPAYCLLIGAALAWAMKVLPGQPVSQTVVLAAFCVVVLSQGLWWRGLMRYVDTNPIANGFGTPLYRLMPLRDELLKHDDVVLITRDPRLEFSQEPAVWTVMLHDAKRCVRAIDGNHMAIYPDGPFAVVIAPDTGEYAVEDVYAGDAALSFPTPPNDESYEVRLFDMTPAVPEMTGITPARFANGAELVGYQLGTDDVRLLWTLPQAQSEDYHTFVHLLDANGERIAQHDEPFLLGRYWCADDRLVTWAAMDIPQDAATLRVGLYALEGERFVNSAVLDAEGHPVESWVDIPLGS
jgi:hypothetical protein